MRRFVLLLGVLVVMVTSASLSAQSTPFHIVGYFTSWGIYGDTPYFVTDIPAGKLTHLNYAFAGVSDDGEIALTDEWADTQFPYPGDTDDQPLEGNFNQLNLLKGANPNLQTLISVGGWTGSAKFSDVALTPESREKFAQSAVDFIKRYGFDGVDIDWEYPTGGGAPGNVSRAQDRQNFVLLLDSLRTHLDAQGETDRRHYPLTIALGAGRSAYQPLDWAAIIPLLDWVNVMTYDLSGAWSSVTGFNSPLYDSTERPPEGGSIDTTVQALLALGIPAEKLVVGVPFYGRGWIGVPEYNHGLHQPFKGVPGTEGSFTYRELAATPYTDYQHFRDEQAQVPWLYDVASQTMISYDDPESLALKAQYVRERSLGGVMFWEIGQDSADSALLTAIYETLYS